MWVLTLSLAYIDLSSPFSSLQAQEYGDVPENESKFFAKIALPEIIPVLLQLLTRQEEDADEDEWNVSMAAGTCIGLLAQAVADNIVPAVIPFIEANIRSQDWHHREAAVMTFGSILEGPDPVVLTPLANQALPILIDMMNDSNPHVKDTVAWTLGRICDLLIGTIKPDVHLHPLVSALVNSLQDNPRIVTNCCWALMNLADQLGYTEGDDPSGAATSPLSPYFDGIVQALLRVTETYVILVSTNRSELTSQFYFSANNEGNYRTAAYEAITSFVTHATVDVISTVQSTAVTILHRMEQLLAMQVSCERLSRLVSMTAAHTYTLLRTRFWGRTTGIIGTICRATSAVLSLYVCFMASNVSINDDGGPTERRSEAQ